jgi:hypothetical protein
MGDLRSLAASYANATVVALGLTFGACAAEEHAVEAKRTSPADDLAAPNARPDTAAAAAQFLDLEQRGLGLVGLATLPARAPGALALAARAP